MRTLLFIVGGFFVYFLLLLTTDRSDKVAIARISLIFIVGWFVVAAGNMVYGLTQAGGGLTKELLIAVLIFLPPAIPAAVLWVRNRRG